MRGIFAHGRQFTSVLLILISATIVSIGGCAGTPITAHPTEAFVDTDAARALVGMPESDVYKRFGEPHWKLDVIDKTYLLYAAAGKVDLMWELFVPFIVLPAEAYSDGGLATLYCAVFEIDKAGKVTQFDSDWSRFYATSRYGKLHTCMGLIPRDALIAERDRLRIKVATEGDNNAYHKLEHIFLDNQGSSLEFFRREYLRKRLKEGDDSHELKMELVRLGELDPFGVLSETKAGQHDAVELDLCAGGKIASIEIDKISEDGTRLPIYHSLTKKDIHCRFVLPTGQYFVSCLADLVSTDSSDPACNRQTVSGDLTLEAGHTYQAKTMVCRHFWANSCASIWIEDVSKQKPVLGSVLESSYRCPQ